MTKNLLIYILLFACYAMQIANAQNSKSVILNLKNGYSVKGEIIEQTAQGVKVKTSNGEIFEYKADEIKSTTDAKSSSTSTELLPPSKIFQRIHAKGDNLFNIGIGFYRQPAIGYSEKLTIPPIPISFEHIVKDGLFGGNGALGVGGFIGYSKSKRDFYSGNYKSSRLILGIRGFVHYTLVEKLDTYGGIFLGYKNDVSKYNNSNYPEDKVTDGKPTLNIFGGCRYFINDKIAGMAELGWGTSIVTIGVAVKL